MYKCIKCGNMFEDNTKGPIRCPSCASRVVEKMRPPITKKLSAR